MKYFVFYLIGYLFLLSEPTYSQVYYAPSFKVLNASELLKSGIAIEEVIISLSQTDQRSFSLNEKNQGTIPIHVDSNAFVKSTLLQKGQKMQLYFYLGPTGGFAENSGRAYYDFGFTDLKFVAGCYFFDLSSSIPKGGDKAPDSIYSIYSSELNQAELLDLSSVDIIGKKIKCKEYKSPDELLRNTKKKKKCKWFSKGKEKT